MLALIALPVTTCEVRLGRPVGTLVGNACYVSAAAGPEDSCMISPLLYAGAMHVPRQVDVDDRY